MCWGNKNWPKYSSFIDRLQSCWSHKSQMWKWYTSYETAKVSCQLPQCSLNIPLMRDHLSYVTTSVWQKRWSHMRGTTVVRKCSVQYQVPCPTAIHTKVRSTEAYLRLNTQNAQYTYSAGWHRQGIANFHVPSSLYGCKLPNFNAAASNKVYCYSIFCL